MWNIVEKHFDFKKELDFIALRKELSEIDEPEALQLIDIIDKTLLEEEITLDPQDQLYLLKKFISHWKSSTAKISRQEDKDRLLQTHSDIQVQLISNLDTLSEHMLKYTAYMNLLLLNLFRREKQAFIAFELMMDYYLFKKNNPSITSIHPKYFEQLVKYLIEQED